MLETLGRRGETTVGGLADVLGVELPILSRHLAVLRAAELVTEQRSGRHRLYRIRSEPLQELFDWASIFSDLWTEKVDNLRGHLDRKKKG